MSLVTSRDYPIHYYEIDNKERALISTIMNYLTDICTIQSDEQNVGIDYLLENRRGWILTQWHLKINRYPTYKETVTVSTQAHSFYKYYAYRKHFIKDSQDNLIVDGESTWLLVDLDKRRPVKIEEQMYDAYKISPNENDRFKSANFKHLDSWDSEAKFNVRYSDIDTNEHVNNVKYISWIIESVPMDITANYEMKELTVCYKKETNYGHTVTVHTACEQTEGGYICKHNIVNEDGEDLTLAETHWRG